MPELRCLHCNRVTNGENRRGQVCSTCLTNSSWVKQPFICANCGFSDCTDRGCPLHWGGLVQTPHGVIELCKSCYLHNKVELEIEGLSFHKCKFCEEQISILREFCLKCTSHVRTCFVCQHKFLERDFSIHNGNYICKECSSKCEVCVKCGNKWLPYNLYKIGDKIYCEKCFNEDYKAIQEYTYKPKPQFYPVYNHKELYMGVELEIEKQNNSCPIPGPRLINLLRYANQDTFAHQISAYQLISTNKHIYIKKDSSLTSGFEIVSHPTTLSGHKEYINWRNILRMCLKDGYESHNTETCGIHVHFNREFLTISEQIKLGMFFSINYAILTKFSRRYSTTFSPFKKLIVDNLNSNNKSLHRHEAINWRNDKTIEVRIFRGTLRYTTFIAIVEFVHFLLYFIKEMPSKTFYNREQSWRDFVTYLELNKKDCQELLKYLKEKHLTNDFKLPERDKGQYEMTYKEYVNFDSSRAYIDYSFRDENLEEQA